MAPSRRTLGRALLLCSAAVGAAGLAAGTAVAATPATCALTPPATVNGGFESPVVSGAGAFTAAAQTGWSTDDPSGVLELWSIGASSAHTGSQFDELNATANDRIWQAVATTPGQTLLWRVAHRGRTGTDVMRAAAGPDAGAALSGATPLVPGFRDGTALANGNPGAVNPADLGDGNGAWSVWSGSYVVPAGQTATRFGFANVSSAGGSGVGNFVDSVVVTSPAAACDDAASTVGAEPVVVDPLANDHGSNLTVALAAEPAHGTVTQDPATHRFAYTAAPGYSGADSFTYTATDDFARSDTATVSVAVAAPPAPPAAPTTAPTAQPDAAVTTTVAVPKTCRSRRSVRINWQVASTTRLKSVTVAVNGKVRARLRGTARTFRLPLLGLPVGRAKVVITGTTPAGARLRATRTYRLCSTSRKSGGLTSVLLRRS